MRRAVRSPVADGTTGGHQLVGVQAAFIQRLDLALARIAPPGCRGVLCSC